MPGTAPVTQRGLVMSLKMLHTTIDKETTRQFSILKQEMQYRYEVMEQRYQISTTILLEVTRRLTITGTRPSTVVQHSVDIVTQEQKAQCLLQRIGQVIQQRQP